MSLFSAGQFSLDQAQQGLSSSAQQETARNIANKNLAEQNKQGKAALGASAGAAAGALAGSVIPGVGTALGGLLGGIAGSFGSKLF